MLRRGCKWFLKSEIKSQNIDCVVKLPWYMINSEGLVLFYMVIFFKGRGTLFDLGRGYFLKIWVVLLRPKLIILKIYTKR